MKTFKIYLEYEDHTDEIFLTGTIAEIREQASREVERRKPLHYWSEEQ